MPLTTPLREVLARHPHIELAILFGSLAVDKARPDSDIDLAVASAMPLDTADFMPYRRRILAERRNAWIKT